MKTSNIKCRFTRDSVEVEVIATTVEQLAMFLTRSSNDNLHPELRCFWCGLDIDYGTDETTDGLFYDYFGCDECGCELCFISPKGRGEYHEVINNGELVVHIDLRAVEVEKAIEDLIYLDMPWTYAEFPERSQESLLKRKYGIVANKIHDYWFR